MFLGSYKPSFDKSTRRIALPKKLRDQLKSNEVILSFGFENCIFGFDTKAWQEESEKQLREPLTSRSSRNIRRFFFASAGHIPLDSQGRLVIPGNLLKHAKIKEPIVIGAGDHFEIWDEQIWQGQQKELGEVR